MKHVFCRTTFIVTFFILFLLPTYASVFANGVIKGHVIDKKSGEPVTGVTVTLDQSHKSSVTGLDGSFTIKDVPAGTHHLTISGISYAVVQKDVQVADNAAADISVEMEASAKVLETVVVNGGRNNTGTTDASARQIEKQSDNVLNVLSARTIQLAPDVTVANVLRRVSGVTVDRGDDGEGRYPVIRGMDKRYNYTLVNGVKIPSPDDKNRYVPMDIFPSEMLQRLEVIKTLTPDMEGDAIGGVMNLVMKDAPEHYTLQAQGALGYGQALFDRKFTKYDHSAVNSSSPSEQYGSTYAPKYTDFSKGTLTFNNTNSLPNGQLGLTIGDRFFHKKLGLIFSGSLQSTDRNSKETFFVFSPQPSPGVGYSTPDFSDLQFRTYSTHEDRIGLHAKADYRFNKNNTISFYTVFMQLNTFRSRFYTDTTSTSRTAPGTGKVEYSQYSRTNFQNIYNATLQGKHTLVTNHLTLDWSAVYSSAGQKTPDKSELITYQSFTAPGSNPPLYANSLSKIWQHNSDKDYSGYLNLHYKFLAGNNKFDLGVGGMARHKDRDNYYNEYSFTNYPGTTPYVDLTTLNGIIPNGGTPNSPDIYTTKEDISAGYGEIRWLPGSKWNILAGVRLEHTHEQYEQTAVKATQDARTGTASYFDWLPSVSIKYSLNPKAALHLSYYESISRPGFFEVVPFEIVGDYYNEVGNYNLHHTQAHNFDARYELFPGLADQFLIGGFYKVIQNPIEYVYARPATSNSVIMPSNIGTAVNAGGEVVYTKYFNKFGVSFNYTYTYSRVSTVDKYYYYTTTPGGGTTATNDSVTVHRPLQGQAAHVGNISLLYKDAKKGTELQLAAIYTGRHIVYASPYYGKDSATAPGGSGMDYWQRGNVIVDLSGEQRLNKHFSFYFKLTNLLNTADIVEMMHSSTSLTNKAPYAPLQDRSDRILVEKKQFGQSYLIGVRYHL